MGNGKIKVTIIIPHYNQKECLKVLLPSIANQTFTDYEVIIIDDFTPDRSAPVACLCKSLSIIVTFAAI